jgi:predicted nucleotidyltransferase
MGNEYSQELIDLAFAALDHGIDSVREGGPLIPFVMTERDEGRTLDRFASDLLEDAVAQAVAHVQAWRSQPGTRHVLA